MEKIIYIKDRFNSNNYAFKGNKQISKVNKSNKTTMSHSFGIPPSPSWGNSNYNTIFYINDCNNIINENNNKVPNTVIYISNSYLVGISLRTMSYNQLLYSNSFINSNRSNSNDKNEEKCFSTKDIKDEVFSCVYNLNNNFLICGTSKGRLLVYSNIVKGENLFFKEIHSELIADTSINAISSNNRTELIVILINKIMCFDFTSSSIKGNNNKTASISLIKQIDFSIIKKTQFRDLSKQQNNNIMENLSESICDNTDINLTSSDKDKIKDEIYDIVCKKDIISNINIKNSEANTNSNNYCYVSYIREFSSFLISHNNYLYMIKEINTDTNKDFNDNSSFLVEEVFNKSTIINIDHIVRATDSNNDEYTYSLFILLTSKIGEVKIIEIISSKSYTGSTEYKTITKIYFKDEFSSYVKVKSQNNINSKSILNIHDISSTFYSYYSSKIIFNELDNTLYCIITTNKGKVYFFSINVEKDKADENIEHNNLEGNNIKLITLDYSIINSSIYSIIELENYSNKNSIDKFFLCYSSNNTLFILKSNIISFMNDTINEIELNETISNRNNKYTDLILTILDTIHTNNNKITNLLYKKDTNSIYLINNFSKLLLYKNFSVSNNSNHKRKLNNLKIFKRELLLSKNSNRYSNIATNSNSNSILIVATSNLKNNYICFLNPSNNSIKIIDVGNDVVLNTLNNLNSIIEREIGYTLKDSEFSILQLNFIFRRKVSLNDIALTDNTNTESLLGKYNKETNIYKNIFNSIEESINNNANKNNEFTYELLVLISKQGILIWDWVLNKTHFLNTNYFEIPNNKVLLNTKIEIKEAFHNKNTENSSDDDKDIRNELFIIAMISEIKNDLNDRDIITSTRIIVGNQLFLNEISKIDKCNESNSSGIRNSNYGIKVLNYKTNTIVITTIESKVSVYLIKKANIINRNQNNDFVVKAKTFNTNITNLSIDAKIVSPEKSDNTPEIKIALGTVTGYIRVFKLFNLQENNSEAADIFSIKNSFLKLLYEIYSHNKGGVKYISLLHNQISSKDLKEDDYFKYSNSYSLVSSSSNSMDLSNKIWNLDFCKEIGMIMKEEKENVL